MELNFTKSRKVCISTGLYSKTSFQFYTGITGWENLKYIHSIFFHKFTGLRSKSSISNSDPRGMKLNHMKRRHGLFQEDFQLQKPFLVFTQLSPAKICRRGCLSLFFNGPQYIYVLCKSWQICHIQVC